jgi:hypothetical protein
MENDESLALSTQEKPKRVRRKFDHPLTEEEKKEKYATSIL